MQFSAKWHGDYQVDSRQARFTAFVLINVLGHWALATRSPLLGTAFCNKAILIQTHPRSFSYFQGCIADIECCMTCGAAPFVDLGSVRHQLNYPRLLPATRRIIVAVRWGYIITVGLAQSNGIVLTSATIMHAV